MTLFNRVRETTSTTGTGDLVLTGAVVRHVAFADVLAAGARVAYCIEDGDNFEIGEGVFLASGQLGRDTIWETLENGVHSTQSPGPIALSGYGQVFAALSATMLQPVGATDSPGFASLKLSNSLTSKGVITIDQHDSPTAGDGLLIGLSAGRKIFFAPRDAGTAHWDKELYYSFSYQKWVVETQLDVSGGLFCGGAITSHGAIITNNRFNIEGGGSPGDANGVDGLQIGISEDRRLFFGPKVGGTFRWSSELFYSAVSDDWTFETDLNVQGGLVVDGDTRFRGNTTVDLLDGSAKAFTTVDASNNLVIGSEGFANIRIRADQRLIIKGDSSATYINLPDTPSFADHAAADAALIAGDVYTLAGDRTLYIKP